MKRHGKGWIALILLLVMLAASAGAETYVENGGRIPDGNLYTGSWNQAYIEVLKGRKTGILAYENRTIEYWDGNGRRTLRCCPVSLEDLTGDGIPELLFLEADDGGRRGDFSVYTSDGTNAFCALYVPGITRLDYEDFLGFRIYLTSWDGGGLVVEHYEYEWPWTLHFTRNALGRYTLANYLHAEYDASGEGNDRYLLNGRAVSWSEYDSMSSSLQRGQYRLISGYMADDGQTYGLSTTWSGAVSTLGGSDAGQSGQNNGGQSAAVYGEVYGYTIDKLATRKGPCTTYDGGGTYSVKNQWIRVLAKAWDSRNNIWWVKCEIPYHGEIRVLWTGYKRFDPATLDLETLPEEFW